MLTAGHVAGQSDGAVIAQLGETVVLATVVATKLLKDPGYFPLQVEYQEKLYAGGKIKGSRWVKREGKPTDDEILSARLIDRSIRPLFPEGYKKDVQVILTVLSVDLKNSPVIAAAIATSAAIAISDIPWKGPIGVTQVGLVDGKLAANPKDEVLKSSKLDLIVSSAKDAVVMIEAGADQIDEKILGDAISFAHEENGKLIEFIEDFVKVAGVEKEELKKEKDGAKLLKQIEKFVGDNLSKLAKQMAVKEAGYAEYDEFKASVVDNFDDTDQSVVSGAFEKLFNDVIRKVILSGKRIDGRKHDELRDLSSEVSVLPRTHGSAIFERGQTQALTITTLGAPSLEQTIETAEGEETKRYIHHYSMPPYSTGETGRVGFPKRREIGHGALAEKALLPVIPSEKDFPYTISVVTEILSSNGSTSMASACGSTLSLMDAGVPIAAPVAGIAMGLVIESVKEYAILTDIVGVEDGAGDMDFKVAGTKDGVTAIQLDVKTLSLTPEILEAALEQAKSARMEILDSMEKTINTPRKGVSKHAPKIKTIMVPKDKIGEVIGPGGKTIKGIIARTGAQIDIDDEGKVTVAAPLVDDLAKAIEEVEMLVKEVEAGEIYDGVVKRIENYGVFVEVLPGKEGLVYISDMSEDFVKDPSDVASLGDAVKVRVKEIDNLGRINLSMILDPSKEKSKDNERRRDSSDTRRSRSSGGYGGRDRRGRGQRDGGKGRSSGPHFPASRLMSDSGDKRFNR